MNTIYQGLENVSIKLYCIMVVLCLLNRNCQNAFILLLNCTRCIFTIAWFTQITPKHPTSTYTIGNLTLHIFVPLDPFAMLTFQSKCEPNLKTLQNVADFWDMVITTKQSNTRDICYYANLIKPPSTQGMFASMEMHQFYLCQTKFPTMKMTMVTICSLTLIIRPQIQLTMILLIIKLPNLLLIQEEMMTTLHQIQEEMMKWNHKPVQEAMSNPMNHFQWTMIKMN